MKKLLPFLIVFYLVSVAASLAEENMSVTDNGIEYEEINRGSGTTADVEDVVTVHFIGWLNDNNAKGKEFLNSHVRGKPVTFKIGTERILRGLSDGVIGMKAGGKRLIMIPSDLGYGVKGAENTVPPNSDLIFEVELLSVGQ